MSKHQPAPALNRRPSGNDWYDDIPEISKESRKAAQRRVKRTEELIDQLKSATTPEAALSLRGRVTPFQAVSLLLAEESDWKLRLLAVKYLDKPKIRVTLQRQEPRDHRWHDLSLSAADHAALLHFLNLSGAAKQLDPFPAFNQTPGPTQK